MGGNHSTKYHMRNLINLVETYSGIDMSKFVNDALVDEILQRGTWTTHGSELFRWWEEGAPEYMTNSEKKNSGDEIAHEDPAFVKTIMRRFLDARAQFINRNMSELAPDAEINRIIMVDKNYLDRLETLRSTDFNLGVYWGSDHVEPWGASYDNIAITPYGLQFTTLIKYAEVNWHETFMSRADWELGDDENEIQLVKGSPISTLTQIEVEASNEDRSYIGRKFTLHPSVRLFA